VAEAFQRRLYADSIMRMKFYVASMPTDHLSELNVESKKRIENMAKGKKL
jgi:hypothetical protein